MNNNDVFAIEDSEGSDNGIVLDKLFIDIDLDTILEEYKSSQPETITGPKKSIFIIFIIFIGETDSSLDTELDAILQSVGANIVFIS